MKFTIVLLLAFFLLSCSKKEIPFISDLDEIEKIEVYKGYPPT